MSRLEIETEQRRVAEEMLVESERRYHGLFEESRDAIFISSLDGRLIDVNPAAVQLLGFESREALLATDAADIYQDPGDREELIRRLKEEGSVEEFELRLKTTDGRLLTVLESSSLVKDERGVGRYMRGMMRDVTEARRMRNEQRRINLALDTLPVGAIITDGRGEIVHANTKTGEIFGYRLEDLVGQPIEMLVPKPHRGRHEAHREAYAAAPGPRAMGGGEDLTGLRRDGSEFPIEIGLDAIEIDGETLIAASIVDITERRQLEEQTTLRARSCGPMPPWRD